MSTYSNQTGRFVSGMVLAASLLASVSTFAADTADKKGAFSSADFKFAAAAATGGLTEVALGKVAAANSTNTGVREFGLRMQKDHGQAGEDLQRLASGKGASLPTEPTAAQQKEIDRLSKLSGPDFDRAYVKLMVRDHKADEKEFRRASEKVEDADLKAFAARTLTVVQEHLKMARDLDGNIKAEVSSNN